MAKRRLPLIQASAEPEAPPRPPWQWSLFAAGLIGLAWLVLALLASPLATLIVRQNVGPWATPEDLARHIEAASPAVVGRMALENIVLHVFVVGVASAAAGFVVGRYGPARAVVLSAVSGALVAVVAVGLASAMATDLPSATYSIAAWGLAVLVPWSSGTAALGAWRGGREKRPLTGP